MFHPSENKPFGEDEGLNSACFLFPSDELAAFNLSFQFITFSANSLIALAHTQIKWNA